MCRSVRFITICVVALAAPMFGSQATRYNRSAIVNYGAGLLPPPLQQKVLNYQAPRYDFFIGGPSVLTLSPSATVFTYVDMAALYPADTWRLKEVAARYGYNYEDMLLHMRANHSFSDGRYAWAGMGRFDACETWYGGSSPTANSTGGVLVINGNAYTDRTTAAWNTTAADVQIADKLLLGYCEPFDRAEFILAVPASTSISVSWEYWNGTAWAPLTLASDATAGLRQNGQVRFLPPADWQRRSEHGSRTKWWIRVSVSGTGTRPVASRILADDWSVPGQPLTWRGWDPASPTRINVGLGPLEYNPTPPDGASAHFRYQARVLGLWANNLHFGNPANIQNGERTWARYLAEAVLPALSSGNNGVFFDDGLAAPNTVKTPAKWQDYTEVAGRDYTGEQIGVYRDARQYVRAAFPSARTCINSSVWDLVRHGDCFLVELANEAHKGAVGAVELNSNSRFWSSASYDQVAPQNNPNGTRGIFTVWDTAGSDFMFNGDYVAWDRGNRSPITALAAYYIVANENTLFSYNTEGWIYTNTDNYWFVEELPSVTLSSEVAADTTADTTKRLFGDFRTFPGAHNSPQKTLTIKLGELGEYLPVWKVNDNELATVDVIGNKYLPGTGIYLIKQAHISDSVLPPVERIVKWGAWFPAMGVDLGFPDQLGHRAGKRDMTWLSAAQSGTVRGVQRRDFSKAIVLHSPGWWSSQGRVFRTYGESIDLKGTYYPLRADGTTGPGVSSIRLRTGEGAILMKAPTGSDAHAAPPPSSAPPAPAPTTPVTPPSAGGSQTVPTTCTFSSLPSSLSVSWQGASYTFSLAAPQTCSWSAASSAEWLQVYPLSGNQSGTLTVTAHPHASPRSRVATITIAGRSLSVAQAGNPAPPDKRFVELLYHTCLNRRPAEPEVAHWQKLLGEGMSREEVAEQFVNSAEFAMTGKFVAGLYVGLLNRDPEYGGWLFQRGALGVGHVSLDGLVSNFLSSAEFVLRNGILSNESFVALLYRQVLGREGSTPEIAGWLHTMKAPANDRVVIARSFLNSAEFRASSGPRLTAFLLYATLLGRGPTTDELNSTMGRLMQGTAVRSMIKELLSSAEFQHAIM